MSLDRFIVNKDPFRISIDGEVFDCMTMRDVFALVQLSNMPHSMLSDIKARHCYEVADAMLAAREAK